MKLRIAASAALVITTMGVGVASTVMPALAAGTTPLPTSALIQQVGHVTGIVPGTAAVPGGPYGVLFTNAGPSAAVFPAAAGDTVNVTLFGVTDAAGAPIATDTTPGSAGFLAFYCGNYTDHGGVTPDTPLTGADVGSLAGIQAHCSPSTAVNSVGGNLSVTIPLGGLPAFNAGSPAQPAVAAVAGSPFVAAGSISAAVPAQPCNPVADVPATLFTPFVAACSIFGGAAAIPANPPADIPAVTAVAGSPAVPAVPAADGTKCQANQTVIPCLLVISDLAQTASFALPVVNATAVSVVGRSTLSVPLGTNPPLCSPTAAPPTGCPAVRADPTPGNYPAIFGGGGFVPGSTVASLQVCAAALAADPCTAGVAVALVAPTAPITASAQGSIAGPFQVLAGAPGDVFLRVTTNLGQVQYAQMKILGTPTAPTFDVAAGAPGVVGTLTGHNFEPRAHVSLQRLDQAAHDFGTPDTAEVNGTGDFTHAFAAGALDFPVASVRVTVVDAAFGAPTNTFTVTFDSQGAVSFCSNTDACNAGELITTSVLPGNVELWTQDAVVDIPAVDLSLIDIQDDTTWYPISDPGAITQVVLGDMRGSNTGFVVTGTASDLVGATQKSNTIPAVDVFSSDAACDVYANAGDGNDPLGVVNSGPDGDPAANPGASALADGSQELCTVLPDPTGRAAGMFQLDANLEVAGRPITAVDDYTGLLTLTITGN